MYLPTYTQGIYDVKDHRKVAETRKRGTNR